MDNLETINRTSEERVIDLETQVADLQSAIARKQAAITDLQNTSEINAALRSRMAEYEQEFTRLQGELTLAEGQLRDLAGRVPDIVVMQGPLPPEVRSALAELAAANPELMEFDETRGMIRVRSVLTFALGSTEVNAAVKTALGRLARVLNSADARTFDIQIVGHTDNVPVRNAANVQQYKDNWGLSAFRARSVMLVLKDAGIVDTRLVIAGRGPTQPIAENGERGNQANRRVEIFLIRGSEAGGTDGQAPPAETTSGGTTTDRPGVVEGVPEATEVIPK